MNLVQIQQSFAEYSAAYEAGQIGPEEYKNLLEGLEIEQAVATNAEEMHLKEQLNTIINSAINIASTFI